MFNGHSPLSFSSLLSPLPHPHTHAHARTHLLDPEVLALQALGLGHNARLDGIVCSAREATWLRDRFGKSFKLVTPGIRLAEDAKGDQARVVTPVDAIKMGADYLVIGRSITASIDPVATLHKINDELKAKEANA